MPEAQPQPHKSQFVSDNTQHMALCCSTSLCSDEHDGNPQSRKRPKHAPGLPGVLCRRSYCTGPRLIQYTTPQERMQVAAKTTPTSSTSRELPANQLHVQERSHRHSVPSAPHSSDPDSLPVLTGAANAAVSAGQAAQQGAHHPSS